MAAKRFRHHLMSEADADHLRTVRLADELLERRDPRQILVNARGGSGDHVSVMRGGLRKLTSLNIETLDFEAGAEQLAEHCGIIAELLGEFAGRAAGFENCDFHARRLATSWPFGQDVKPWGAGSKDATR